MLLLLVLELFSSLVRASCHPCELMARTCTPPAVLFSILGVNSSKKTYYKQICQPTDESHILILGGYQLQVIGLAPLTLR